MTLADGIRFIWLDAHISEDGKYQDFKSIFQKSLAEAAAVPPAALDVLISAMDEAAPFSFAQTPAQAATLIETFTDLAIEYERCLQMFDHEIDLAIRLARDISQDIIEQGQMYMGLNDGENALNMLALK